MTEPRAAVGFVDIQVNGGWGHDFTADPSSIWAVGRRLPETGVTRFLPTIVSAPYPMIESAIDALAAGPPAGYVGADPIGLHIEGPWISPEWRGAHNPEHLRLPDRDVASEWASSGMVRMVTLAPELEQAFEVAEILDEAGVVVSAGHSGAGFDVAEAALTGPWSAVTHLFNQMSPFQHRSPGMVGAALLSERPCGVIVDGLHSDPASVRLAWERLGPDRFMLITDAMQATGLDAGSYLLGDREVVLGPDGPRIGSILAGSTLTMDRAVANLVEWAGASVDEALTSASITPARLIGSAGGDDVITLDDQLNIVETTIDGAVAFTASEH